jgi:site-specific recombinase XerD
MKISEYKTKYLLYCRVEKENCSDSVDSYERIFRKIVSLIGNISVFDINQDTILNLKERLMNEFLSDSYRSKTVSVIRNFLAYLSDFIGLDVYDYKKITIPRVKSKPVKTLSTQEIDDIIESMPDRTLKDKRLKGLSSILADSGARISEILNLKRDIDLKSGKTVVLGKGKKFRMIYWGGRTKKFIRDYLDARPKWDKSPYLFGTVNNGNYGGKWDKGDVNRAFRRLSKKLNRRIHCHLFRSSFLTNCLHQGLNLSAVSKAMGHSDIRTSMRYFSPMSDENTENEFENFFSRKATVSAQANIINENERRIMT